MDSDMQRCIHRHTNTNHRIIHRLKNNTRRVIVDISHFPSQLCVCVWLNEWARAHKMKLRIIPWNQIPNSYRIRKYNKNLRQKQSKSQRVRFCVRHNDGRVISIVCCCRYSETEPRQGVSGKGNIVYYKTELIKQKKYFIQTFHSYTHNTCLLS